MTIDPSGVFDESTESDRLTALKMALELHKQGQGIARSAEAVIGTANQFLAFVHDPQVAGEQARLIRQVRKAIEVLYRAGNITEYPNTTLRLEMRGCAKALNDMLHLPFSDLGEPTAYQQ